MSAPLPQVQVRRAPYGRQAEINAAVESLMAALPACGRLGPASRVLIKPNLLRKNAPEAAVTSDPMVLRAVILALQSRGVRSITVADSPGGPYTPAVMRSVYKGCGIAAVCEETGAAAYTACEEFTRPGAGPLVREAFTFIKPVEDADFIVGLPKLKTHVLTTVSGAVKNLFGCIPGLRKAEYHMRFPDQANFGAMLVEVCQAVRADVHIVDGLLAMEGDGPGSGTPRRCDVLLAGEDPYAVDLAICRMMGVDPMATPILASAHARGLCGKALAGEQLAGATEAAAPVAGFRLPAGTTGRVDFGRNLPGFLRPLMPAVARMTAPRPVIRKGQCIGCGKCAEICPQQVITLPGGVARIDHKGCIRCFCCHEMCPVHAVDVRRLPVFRL